MREDENKFHGWLIAILGGAYALWMIYGSGFDYLLVSTLLYAPGILLYAYHRKNEKKKIFENVFEIIVALVLVIGFIATIVLISNGTIDPF